MEWMFCIYTRRAQNEHLTKGKFRKLMNWQKSILGVRPMIHRPRERKLCLRGASDSRSASCSSLHWSSALVSSLDWVLLWILRPGLWLSGEKYKECWDILQIIQSCFCILFLSPQIESHQLCLSGWLSYSSSHPSSSEHHRPLPVSTSITSWQPWSSPAGICSWTSLDF